MEPSILYHLQTETAADNAAVQTIQHAKTKRCRAYNTVLCYHEKAAGAPYSPTAHAIPDATAEAASRYLKNVGRACSKPQNTRGRHKKR